MDVMSGEIFQYVPPQVGGEGVIVMDGGYRQISQLKGPFYESMRK